MVHSDPDSVLFEGIQVPAKYHLELGVWTELLLLHLLDELPQVVYVLHFRGVDTVEQSHALLAVESLAFEQLQFAFVGGPGEPILEGGEVGVVLVTRVAVEAVLEVLDGFLLASLLREEVEPQDGVRPHRGVI
jgi:hypothetical protein